MLDAHGWPDEGLGEGDAGLQAYAYRVCLTHGEERLPFEPPEDYDERDSSSSAATWTRPVTGSRWALSVTCFGMRNATSTRSAPSR